MTKQEWSKMEEECVRLNTPEHGERIVADYSGNLGIYRIASHDGANYVYTSDWYGQAMSTVRTIEEALEIEEG